MNNVIKVNALCKDFGDRTVLTRVSLNVNEGEKGEESIHIFFRNEKTAVHRKMYQSQPKNFLVG